MPPRPIPPAPVLVEYRPVHHVDFDLKPTAVVVGPAASLVQANGGNSASPSGFGVAFPGPVTAGNLVVAAVAGVALEGVAGTDTVTDSLGNTLTAVGTVQPSASDYSIQLWWAHTAAGGADTVTWASGAGNVDFFRLIIMEYSGVTALDAHSQAAGTVYPLDSGAMTTSAAGLVVGWGISDNNVTSAGSGYTLAFTETSQSTEWQATPGAGVYHATFPGDGASAAWACTAAAFK